MTSDNYTEPCNVENDTDIDDLEIAALVTGELKGEEREKALRRLVDSPSGLQKYRILTELHVAARPDAGYRWTYSAAAVVLLAIGVTFFLSSSIPTPMNDGTVLRGPDHERVVPEDNALLDRLPTDFSWPAEPGAERYRVVFHGEEQGEIWSSEWTNLPKLKDIPQGTFAGQRSERRYYWIVEVDGRTARSQIGPFWLRLGESNNPTP